MNHANIACRALLLTALLALGACTTAPPSGLPGTATLRTEAEAARSDGNLARAAALYDQSAATSRGAQRADDLLMAASLWIETGDFGAAGQALARARESSTPAQQTDIDILAARIDVASGRAAEALARLDAAASGSTGRFASIAAEARGLALFMVGRPAEAVEVLVEREIWLNDAAAILDNQQLIWEGLAALRSPPPPVANEIVAGWLALAPLTGLADDPVGFRRALVEWRSRFATHPAASGVLADIIAEHRGELEFPRRIALLLPLDSARRIPAQAVRDGFLAARIADPRAAETTVVVYDTAERGPTDAYVRAQADGADFIVGPLLPEAVEQVIPQTGFVPTLTLNFSQNQNAVFPPGLYQYALAPEDEARAIAERAIAEGQRRAVGLFASTDRGYRLMESFRDAFEALGGEVVAASAYVPESQDASGPITDILNIARSDQRYRRLQANLGQQVEFESRRRQDVDMIFMQATPGLGRLLVPQLRFHRAGDIPTYATSDIYDTARVGRDSDLDGVIFPDLPILVAPEPRAAEFAAQVAEFWPQRSRPWIRFYSFGFDAYALIRPIFTAEPGAWPVRGITGLLQLAPDGRVHRALPFAQFRNGTPNALEAAPATEVLSTAEPVTNRRNLLGVR